MSQLKTCSGHIFVRECYFRNIFLRKRFLFLLQYDAGSGFAKKKNPAKTVLGPFAKLWKATVS